MTSFYAHIDIHQLQPEQIDLHHNTNSSGLIELHISDLPAPQKMDKIGIVLCFGGSASSLDGDLAALEELIHVAGRIRDELQQRAATEHAGTKPAEEDLGITALHSRTYADAELGEAASTARLRSVTDE